MSATPSASAPPLDRRRVLRLAGIRLGLAGAGAAAILAAPKIARRFDRLDPDHFALPALEDARGRGLASADLSGAPAVLCFWASWCPDCVHEHARLVELARSGVRLLGVAALDDGPRAARFLRERGDPFAATGLDAGGALLRGFGFRGVPGFVATGRAGERLLTHEGPIDDGLARGRLLTAYAAA